MGTGSFPGVKRGQGLTLTLHPFKCRGHERVELYLCSPYWPYGLYRASVPVQGCALPLPYKVSCLRNILFPIRVFHNTVLQFERGVQTFRRNIYLSVRSSSKMEAACSGGTHLPYHTIVAQLRFLYVPLLPLCISNWVISLSSLILNASSCGSLIAP
jgi:hypothetical protein